MRLASTSEKSSATGTSRGGSLANRSSPSSMRVSRSKALRWFLVSALAARRWRLRTAFPPASAPHRRSIPAMSRREYHTSSVVMAPNSRMASR
jgi:hypothetical protein